MFHANLSLQEMEFKFIFVIYITEISISIISICFFQKSLFDETY